jgi:hypothetical protein
VAQFSFGVKTPNEGDKQYLAHFRKHFKLPIYYSQFLWGKRDFDEKF